MREYIVFFCNSILLGVGLAMDAFSVSLANGLHEPQMRRRKMVQIAGVFALFQALMPMAGWVCVHTILRFFQSFSRWIPWIALGLLGWIGGKMLVDGIRSQGEETPQGGVGFGALLVQGVATSIDALSVGFTIADYGLGMALVCSLLIALVTFLLCTAGLLIGRRCGVRLSRKASILGGAILIAIGLEIWIQGLMG